jgi:GxxExxY protein
MLINDISQEIIGAAIEVHRHLGPGLLESAYQACLKRELVLSGLECEVEVPVAVNYKNEIIDVAYRADMLIEGKVLVELKAVDSITEKHRAQLLTYLRLCNKRLGLLLNFNETVLKNGVARIVNNL